jgi:transaldolase
MDNPLRQLHALGQSIWLDYIRRDLFAGELDRLIEEDGLAGLTSNPTIFADAIGKSALYDDAIRGCDPALAPEAVFEAIAVADVQQAADRFRPLHEATGGSDGFVSIEVRPALAYDADGTIAEVRRLWAACDRPNVMVKIPGTRPGLIAIERCLAEGIQVNVTLLFAVERYLEVMDAWCAALEARIARGEPVRQLASVASFFVSRVDTAVNRRLAARRDVAGSEAEREAIARLMGRVAIANARIAYQRFEERVGTPRIAALERAGAQLQRPLWASTSTKDPALPDVYYVEALIAPQTVSTLPPATLAAYRDHGRPAVRIHDELDEAHRILARLAELGIDYGEVTAELEAEGVRRFARSYDELIATIAEKHARVQGRAASVRV